MLTWRDYYREVARDVDARAKVIFDGSVPKNWGDNITLSASLTCEGLGPRRIPLAHDTSWI